ncbi:MAG TPA: hypothetical protein VFL55_19825 [Acetobacteraceae bacterium]|nr:hypothetical protein [Acetobacteraceae bacterium]
MRCILAVLFLSWSLGAIAQPADCPQEPTTAPVLPLGLDLADRPGVPPGTTGKAYVGVPMGPPGIACATAPPPVTDVLRGGPGDLLRGPGRPHVIIEAR